MKEIWARISYAWFIGILIFVGLFVPSKLYALTNWSTNSSRLVLDNAGTPENTSWTTSSSAYTPQLPVLGLQYRVRSSDGLSKDNTYKFTVAYKPTPDALYGYSITLLKSENEVENANCSGFTRFNDGYYKSTCVFTPEYNYSSTDYLYIRIAFYSGYVNTLGIGISGYEYTKGVGSLVTEGANNIINNNNYNTQQIIDNQNNLFTSDCSNILNLTSYDEIQKATSYTVNDDNVVIVNTTDEWAYIDYQISVSTNKTYYLSLDSSNSVNQDLSVTILGGKWSPVIKNETFSGSYKTSFNSGNNSSIYIRFFASRNYSGNTVTIRNVMLSLKDEPFCVYGSKTNKIDETTDAIKDLNDTIEDDDVEDPDEMISEMEDLLPENGVITQLIALPVTLYTKVLNNINGTCSSQNLGSLYGTNLVIPCIDVDDYLGSTLWNTIDILISGFFIYVIAKKMIKVFNNFTSMKEGDVIGD